MAKQKEVPVQFAALAGLRERRGQENLTILDGMIASNELLEWLAKWSFEQMPWQMWETTNDFELKHKAPLPKKSEIELMMLERVSMSALRMVAAWMGCSNVSASRRRSPPWRGAGCAGRA